MKRTIGTLAAASTLAMFLCATPAAADGVIPLELFAKAPQYQDRILNWLPDDPRHVIIELDPERDVYPGVFKLDVYSGHLRPVQVQRPPVVSERIVEKMREILPDRFTFIIGGSRDERKILLAAFSDVKPTTYYLLDLDANKLRIIGGTSAELDEATLAPMKSTVVPAGDLRIPGYLTVPVGREPKHLPMVVYPHGGPYARRSWGYDPVVQMLASRGYAVLQVNFRGSTGYGAEWFRAGWQGWGGAA